MRRGVHVDPDAVAAPPGEPRWAGAEREHLLRAHAVGLTIEPGTVFSHATAALLHGLPAFRMPLGSTTVTRHLEGSGSRHGSDVICHNAPLEGRITDVDGRPVTSVARTVADCARAYGVETGLVVADAALHRSACTREELAAATRELAHRTGVSRARIVVDAADARAESPLETVSRWRLDEMGMPTPELQRVFGLGPDEEYRCDFYWEQWRVVGECDGLGKYGADDVAVRRSLRAEKARESALRARGIEIIRWTWDDLRRPDLLATRLREEFDWQERRHARGV